MSSQPNRKILDKLLWSTDIRREHRDLMNTRTASRFVQGIRDHSDPMEVLFQLDKRDPHLLRTIFTLDSSSDFMNSVVMPFLGWLGQDNLSIGTSCYKQQLVCNELARAPGLLEALLEALKCDEISDEMALVWFLERLLLDDGEEGAAARSSDGTHSALVDRLTRSMAAPVKTQAEKLLKILTDPGAMAKRIAEIATTGVASTGGISLEAVQESLPGGRHSNDHVDFRSITIVPSVDEVLCEKIPFLPTERDADVSHLDRQFRLLRHDLVASVVDALTPLKSLRTGAGKSKGPGNAKGGGGGGGGRPLLVLEQAKRGAIVADNGGRAAAVLIHFAWPPTHPISHMKSAQKQKDYLQQAKGGRGGGGGGGGGGAGRNLLKRDSLVILTDKSLKPLLFASITIRDEDRLVGGDWGGNGGRGRGAGRGGSFRGGRGTSGGNRSGRGRGGRGGVGWNGGGSWREWQESRPAVGVSFFCRQDLEAALLLSRDDSWGCLVPLSVGVFAYESVLKKLQTMADVPMGNLLVDWPAAHRAFLGSENGQQASLWQSVKGLWQSMENQASSAAPSPPETPQPPLYEGLQAEAMEQLAERFAPTPEGLKSRTSLVVSPPLPGVTLPAGCQFDISQRVAVAQVLRQRVSLVQGPPGTGKTFLGVFLAQTILSSMAEKILCVCYTNHALDSLLEDMLNKGITSMVRIGGGSKNPKLDAYQLRSRQAVGFDRVQNRRYAHLKGALEESQEKIDTIQRATRLNSRPDKMEVVAWLEDEDPEAFRELQMPEGLGGAGHTVVGKRGRALTGASIVQMWLDGNQKPSALLRQPANATRSSSSGNSNNHQTRAPPTSGIWAMDRNARKAAWDTWEAAIKAEAAKRVARKVMTHDMLSRELSELERQKDLQRVRGARVVGCTTTGAAIHHALLAEARCGVVLVEEAAEVLEAHVLTALEESTKHLIMIGDHKQLRPKVEQYSLRVESGRGFDLNVSLFERLVKSGYPHTTLELQHRMPPEVSALVRGLTYPGLRDGPGTANRPPIRGVRDRVCFVAHRNKEETASSMRQRQDDGVSASKVNGYEVRMVDKTVKYLLLQGYEPDQLVVLTPYLAQLREIRDKIDGALSSQDASDLAAAVKLGNGDTDAGGSPGNGDGGSSGGKGKSGGGHKGSGGGKGGGGGGDGGSGGAPSVSRKSVRVATVDNYQGEESDIVIVSFVRSNDGGQMGFVGDPNRLNVAISRARHGMIMFGDIDFFTSDSIRNKSGQRLWLGFLSLLEAGGHVYRDGLPVACETHKTRADMSTPEAFDELAPDGGCRVICGAKLTCDGRHPCPRRCHPGDDRNHENASCTVEVEDTCFKGHKSKRRCSKDPAGLPCRPCEREAAAVKREVERHAEAKAARERDREAATARLAGARRNAALEREKLAHERELMSLERETQRAEIDAERTRLSQKGAHASLEGARATAAAAASTAPAAPSAAPAAAPAADAKRGRKVKATAATTVNDKGEDNIRETATAAACGASSSVQIFGAKAGNRNHGVITPTTPKGSTLLLIAEAAGRGDARGITDALQAVPSGKGREQTCHALAVALGDSAYDWFARGSGGEPSPVGPPTQRTVQALGMVASGEWVKARAILAAIVKDTTAKKEGVNDSSKPPFGGNTKQVDPAAVYALALCDHQIAGGSGGTGSAAANKQLDELAAVELALWPGPPDSRPPPDARAFPLGALVRAHLLAAAALPPSPQQERSDGVGGTASSSPTQDPKARACSLAVAFLRAPAHALRVGKVDSRAWFAAAEALVKENGGSLARELWGPGGGSGDDSVEYGRPAGGGGDDDDDDEDVIKAEWKKLQTKWGVSSEGMDLLLEMSGLDAIKADFLRVAKLTIINMERGFDPASGSFNIRLEGNPGTGKTTVARLYYRLLKDLRVFAAAESRAQDAKITAEAEAKKNADAAEKARQDAERRAFQSVGLPYTQSAARAGAGTSTPTATSASARLAGSTAATAGFVETTGADLADKGVRGLKDMLKKIREAGGGVLFVDEAYTLEPQGSGGGKQVLNFLLAEIENRRGELVVAFAGYAKNMETLFEFNEGLPSRFPKILRFADYSDALLLDIFKGLMAKKQGLGTLHFAAAGPIEGAGVGQGEGDQEWWAKVAIARLGRRRGAPGFGNARAVRVLFDEVMERQADRLSSCGGGSGDNLNPYELQKSDLLGKSVDSLDESEDWRTLRDMIGLTTVKKAVLALAEVVKTNRMLEEVGKPPRDIALNRCMLGNPGTGKTTVARLFAGILADLGLLSKGEVVLKTASDFVGSVLGESESKTRAILKASEGCVLVIDEAYSLSAVSGVGSGGSGDPYRTAVTDTLVEQVQNVPGEDRCVLLLGYPEQMKAFMRNTNPGLARRFALENAFKFEDYTDEELLKILRGKLRREQMEAGVEALMAAASVLAKKRATASHFGNGGDVATLLSEAKLRKENRRKDDSMESRLDPELLPQDFDPEYGVGPADGATLEKDLFGDLIGCGDIKLQLKRTRAAFILAERLGRDPREAMNMNFRFTGAPGTGKTTVAQRVGRMFKQLKVIHSDEVLSCSPSDMTTGFVGQAAKKTKEIMDKAIGKVLFIDEAYGLNPNHGGSGASFMQEAVDQLVQCMTDDKYKGKMVVIVAGYVHDIDELMESNPGLASRFPETLHFPNFGVDDCCHLFESVLKRGYSTELAPGAAEVLRELLPPIVEAPRFGNGRTITDLAKNVFTEIGMRIGDNGGGGGGGGGGSGDHDDETASVEDIRRSTAAILKQMSKVSGGANNANVSAAAAATAASPGAAFSTESLKAREAPKATIQTSKMLSAEKVAGTKRTAEERDGDPDDNEPKENPFLSVEDLNLLREACEIAGIDLDSPDIELETNEPLRRDFLLSRAEGGLGFSSQQTQAFIRKVVADRAALSRLVQEGADTAAKLAANEADADRALAEAEEAAAKEGGSENDEVLAMLRRAKEELERKLASEAASQAALQRMGVCPAGFKWNRLGSGWRCAGGSHYVAGSAVAAEILRGKESSGI